MMEGPRRKKYSYPTFSSQCMCGCYSCNCIKGFSSSSCNIIVKFNLVILRSNIEVAKIGIKIINNVYNANDKSNLIKLSSLRHNYIIIIYQKQYL